MTLHLSGDAAWSDDQRMVRLEERVARLYDELRLPLYLYLLCMRILPKPDYTLEGGDMGAILNLKMKDIDGRTLNDILR
ncbi:MAG TPA: hypothetical protein VIM67_06750 [Terriglobus sp.]